MVVPDREHAPLALVEPLCLPESLAIWTASIPARIVVRLFEATLGTGVQMAPESSRPTGKHVVDELTLAIGQAFLREFVYVASEDISDGWHPGWSRDPRTTESSHLRLLQMLFH